jgi:SNF2 family DNA or RNA helicase
MGLGKTFVGSEKMKSLNSKHNIIVCQKSKIDDWVDHYKTYYPEIKIIDYTKPKAKLEPGVIIINYDLIFRRSELLRVKPFTLMLDESSLIQNESNKRSKFVLRMEPENVILLSGTPTAGKYEKLWSQCQLLGWDITKDLFWKHYVETEWVEDDEMGFMRKDVVGYKNVDRLKMKFAQHGAVFMKSEEVIDLPEQVLVKVKVNPTKEYRKFMKNHLITIDTVNKCEFKDGGDFYGNDVTPRVELVGDSTLTKRLYARMLCGHYNKEKLKAFKDLVDSTEDRMIVFYNFNDELAALKALVEDRPVSFINGSGKNMYAYEYEPNSITFVQYQAGAMGLDLQKANKVIYFTLPQSSELFEQSKKRIHRIGQNNRCFYYLMICRGSVEEDILKTLEMRKDYTDELFRAFEKAA